MVSGGWEEQPAPPAGAREAPISFRKVRRSVPSSHSEAWRGNSLWSISSNSSVSASSSRLCQNSRPRFSRSRARADSIETGRLRIWYSSGKVSLMCIYLSQTLYLWHVEQLVICADERTLYSLFKSSPSLTRLGATFSASALKGAAVTLSFGSASML